MNSPQNSFTQHTANSIALARTNLAEVMQYRLETGFTQTNPREAWHVMGNLVIAAAAMHTDGLRQGVSSAISEFSQDPERTQAMVGKALTPNKLRIIYPLLHIPNGAPEIRVTSSSREMVVGRFIDSAHALNLDRPLPTDYEGMGKGLFLGLYGAPQNT